MTDTVVAALRSAQDSLSALLKDEKKLQTIGEAGARIAEAFRLGHRVFSCGNGGSLCDAMHFAEECSGRFRKDRPPLPALAIADASHISCTANDFGWTDVFSRFLAAHGRSGDVLLAISTSGSSGNVLAAAREARIHGMSIIALTGKEGSELGSLADFEVCTVGGQYSDRVQELHIKVLHIFVEIVERALFPELYR